MRRIINVFAKNIVMHEIVHIISGCLLACVVYSLFGQIKLSLLSFLVSLLIDMDHFFELIVYRGLDLSYLKKGLNYWRESGKMTILFHSWELLVIFWLAGRIFNLEEFAFSIIIPAFFHYLYDQIIYTLSCGMSVGQYFFLYRAYHKFDFNYLLNKK